MTLLTLVRHGQTDWNLARRIQGSTDIPLNDTGRADAHAAAAVLAELRPDAIYTSPLVRARETAQIIAGELGLPEPGVTRGLREREFGDGEGMLVADYLARYGDWHAEVPGAETMAQVRDRALDSLERIVRASRRRSAPRAESIVVVSHGGVIRALLQHVSGGTLPREGDVLRNGSVHRFLAERGTLRLLDEVPVQVVAAGDTAVVTAETVEA
ncbi:histidine phosphatase family protein [Microbacterium sp. EF45047]|uniref:histidine phosphatase family protein n=1 Tax=Microbacterium sp. EF45047 TaxID=2809708 RepID=UPI0023492378|nr:histidine phosphatase family protein [Microbacterium sp. EF45047]WCM54757.1 histidine phosphatase family protein [Microbacterium sp. EF45047]